MAIKVGWSIMATAIFGNWVSFARRDIISNRCTKVASSELSDLSALRTDRRRSFASYGDEEGFEALRRALWAEVGGLNEESRTAMFTGEFWEKWEGWNGQRS